MIFQTARISPVHLVHSGLASGSLVTQATAFEGQRCRKLCRNTSFIQATTACAGIPPVSPLPSATDAVQPRGEACNTRVMAGSDPCHRADTRLQAASRPDSALWAETRQCRPTEGGQWGPPGRAGSRAVEKAKPTR